MNKDTMAGFYLALDWLNGAYETGVITEEEYNLEKERLILNVQR